MFDPENTKLEAFPHKIWLSSPTMYGPELTYMKEAYETNWMSTVGENLQAAERLACEQIGCGYAVALASGTASLHMAVKLAGEKMYGQPESGNLIITEIIWMSVQFFLTATWSSRMRKRTE